ncbi:hypothetical protein HYC85_024084 [Camellia sinensis]|uniref:CRAL-TRIO domain-containing protein n=1 Tax=Camellia sinensis TaxID=4442 RepID=A0A7J7GAS5_CAMSI|nr:hypothetical protein HYC85_024084 [Camellia sinensis]
MAETSVESLLPTVTETETPLPPPAVAESEIPVKPEPTVVEVIESEKPKPIDPQKVPQSLISFREESNRVADLSDSERKALEEFRFLLQEALNKHEFTYPPPPAAAKRKRLLETSKTEISDSPPDEVSIWGVPLLKDDTSDVILLKFLRARDFKVRDALAMLRNTILWRKEFNVDALIDEDLGEDLEKVVFMHCFDMEGHPVCYNVYGEFQNKELYQKTFADEKKRMRFLRWRIQFLERSIRKLDFSPGGISTLFQVSDLKNSPGPAKRELRIATRQALQLLQDNYPEFVAKQVFINVPWWYLAFYTMISPFLTQRTKSKFVFAGPSKTAETLFKYISPEQVPIQYGGLSVDFCDCNPEFSIDDPATEITVKPATKQTVEIQVNEMEPNIVLLSRKGWTVVIVGVGYDYEIVFISSLNVESNLIQSKSMVARQSQSAKVETKIGDEYLRLVTISMVWLSQLVGNGDFGEDGDDDSDFDEERRKDNEHRDGTMRGKTGD